MRAFALCVVGLTVVLGGCGPIQGAQQAAYVKERMAQANAEMAACVEKRKTSVFKTRVGSATCINDASLGKPCRAGVVRDRVHDGRQLGTRSPVPDRSTSR
jgi:hypothetical protein